MKTKTIMTIIKLLLSLLMITGGIQHFVKPSFYMDFAPTFLPCKMSIIYISGIVEILLGVLLLTKKFGEKAALGIFLLMIVFLPIHMNDIISTTPAIGSQKAALIRLPFQFVFIFLAWKLRTYLAKK